MKKIIVSVMFAVLIFNSSIVADSKKDDQSNTKTDLKTFLIPGFRNIHLNMSFNTIYEKLKETYDNSMITTKGENQIVLTIAPSIRINFDFTTDKKLFRISREFDNIEYNFAENILITLKKEYGQPEVHNEDTFTSCLWHNGKIVILMIYMSNNNVFVNTIDTSLVKKVDN